MTSPEQLQAVFFLVLFSNSIDLDLTGSHHQGTSASTYKTSGKKGREGTKWDDGKEIFFFNLSKIKDCNFIPQNNVAYCVHL